MKKLLLSIIVMATFAVIYYWQTRDYLLQIKYDLTNKNTYVKSEVEIMEILSVFKAIPIENMDPKYLEKTGQTEDPFEEMLEGVTYLSIPRSALYQKIVGDFRIKAFMPKDDYYKQSLYTNDDSLFWLVDEQMLFQVLAFQDLLEERGFDRDAFVITNGFRHPKFNHEIGGASQSRHIVGEAVDITAKDINNDGVSNQEDKLIIVDVAEKVVGNTGGVGLYPGTLSIHMDTRGYRARWDSF